MRILHVVPSYIPAWRYGGPIHSVHGLCKALAARGHTVDVATTNVDGDGNSDVPLARPVDLEGVRVHYFPSTRLRRLYYSPGMRTFMAASMGTWDIVHTHSVFLWPTTSAARLARRHHKPYVLSPRGMLVRDLIQRRSPWLKRGWIGLFERRNVAEAAAVHVTSAVEAQEMLAMAFRPRSIIDIPNGFDLPIETVPPDRNPASSAPYALFLGRISWKKGLDRLMDALPLAPGVRVVVAGNDDEDYWPKMRAKIAALALGDRVTYKGFVEGDAKQELLGGAAFLVLPSYSENFGNVVLEAMAMGVPVIVTPEVGLSGSVSSTESGIVCAGEPAILAEAMTRLANDSVLRSRLAVNARRTAASYSWANVAERMEAAYSRLVAAAT